MGYTKLSNTNLLHNLIDLFGLFGHGMGYLPSERSGASHHRSLAALATGIMHLHHAFTDTRWNNSKRLEQPFGYQIAQRYGWIIAKYSQVSRIVTRNALAYGLP